MKKPAVAASALTTKSSSRAWRPGALQGFDYADHRDGDGRDGGLVAGLGQAEGHTNRDEGKRMLAVVPERRMRP